MTFKYLIALLMVFGVCSCSEAPEKNHKLENNGHLYLEKNFGLIIENGPRRGWAYVDSLGTVYSYLSITTCITNDTTLPVRLKISFAKEYNYIRGNGSLKSKVFLLPKALTPHNIYARGPLSEELRNYLNRYVDSPISLDEIIPPTEKRLVTFGVLTDRNEMKGSGLFQPALIASEHKFNANAHDSLVRPVTSLEDPLTLSLALTLDSYIVIPCGQIASGISN